MTKETIDLIMEEIQKNIRFMDETNWKYINLVKAVLEKHLLKEEESDFNPSFDSFSKKWLAILERLANECILKQKEEPEYIKVIKEDVQDFIKHSKSIINDKLITPEDWKEYRKEQARLATSHLEEPKKDKIELLDIQEGSTRCAKINEIILFLNNL